MFETRNDPQPDPREGAARAGLPPPVAALKDAGARLAEVDYHGLEAAALTTTVTVLARVASQIAAATAAATDAALTTGTVRDSGAASATQWLVETGGGSAKKARRTAGRASRLRELPETEKALSEGELTPAEHVDVIIGAVRRGRLGDASETEQALLETATKTTPEELRRQVKTREEAAREESLLEDENAAYARRRAWAGTTKQGTYRLEAELDPVSGAGLATALQAFTHLDDASVPDEERRSADQRSASRGIPPVSGPPRRSGRMAGPRRSTTGCCCVATTTGVSTRGAGGCPSIPPPGWWPSPPPTGRSCAPRIRPGST